MDEPTNHLDAESRDVLLQALMSYEGTLCLVSHDRDFVAPLVDQLLEVQNGSVTPLVISYEEYLAKKVQETRDRIKSPKKDNQVIGRNPVLEQADTPSSGTKKPSNNQARAWQTEFGKIEKEIVKLEAKQGELNHRLASEDLSQNPTLLRDLIEEQSKNQVLINEKLSRWEELASLIT